MLDRIGKHLLTRLALIAVSALLALWWRLQTPAPAPATVAGLGEMLGAAVSGRVDEDALVWEPSGGPLVDPLLGRKLLFLASQGDGLRDLYRATVRVSREGRPISISRVCNLTNTPFGDEAGLVSRGRQAAFITHAFEVVQAATVLHLDGPARAGGSLVERVLLALDNWLWRGSLDGIERTEVVFGMRFRAARIELRDGLLVLALGEPPRAAAVDLATGSVNLGGRVDSATRVWTIERDHQSRGELWTSVLRGALGRSRADGLRSWTTATARRLGFDGAAASAGAADPIAPRDDPSSWPPPVIPTSTERPDDGHWSSPAGLRAPRPSGLIGEPRPSLLVATIQPDGASTLHLLAADMRPLELRFQAGQISPKPTAGPGGSGRLRLDQHPAAVAAFNGGLDSMPVSGMMSGGRVLVPPTPSLGTVAIDLQGRARLGAWPGDTGAKNAVPNTVHALRQSLELLIEDGRLNPSGRTGWGLRGDSVQRVERSALCRTTAGHMIYGWSEAIDAAALARGMRLAGCQDALHLAMSPTPTGFAFLPTEGERSEPLLLAEAMSLNPQRFLDGSAHDLFYLVLREVTPRLGQKHQGEKRQGKNGWKPDGGAQPPPAWLPAVHRSETEQLGAAVSLWAIEVDRFRWQIRPGMRERAGLTSAGPLDTAELAHAMIAISLGVGFRRTNRRGLALDGMVALPIHGDRGVLASDPAGRLSIARSIDDMAPRGDASEVLLLAEGGTTRSEAKRLGSRRARSAACMLDDRTLLVAKASSDSLQPITRALLDLGCKRVVSLNRGRQVRAFIHRAGTDPAPRGSYDDTILYGMSKTAEGRLLPFASTD